MDPDRLFLATLDDLERRAVTTDEYEALMAAGLIRKLLTDTTTPLVDLVNREHRLSLRFLINGPTAAGDVVASDGAGYWSLEDFVDGGIELPSGWMAPVEATRDQFLGRQVMAIEGHAVTVRDLIDQLAHIEGAVHSALPDNPREELLRQAAREFYIGGLPAGVRQLQAVARVVLRGLEPLRLAVVAANHGS